MNKTAIGIILAGIVLSVLVLSSGNSEVTALRGAPFVTAYTKSTNGVLLDVRTGSEFAEGHLSGAVNIDFQSPTFVEEVKKLDTTKDYFVYCRSGNRSQKAIAIMKNAGIKNITELSGGIVSNSSALSLVTAQVGEYVVSPSDMLSAPVPTAGVLPATLTEKEKDGLVFMREEEKLAYDVYTTLGAKWGMQIFSNIARSEATHTEAVRTLLAHYGVADPASGKPVGVFVSPQLQKLYDELVVKGLTTQSDALIVGATVEDLDIRDLDVLMGETDKQDILAVYANLQRGSRNHLRAFVRNIEAGGGTYTPVYITPLAFSAIINSSQERGR